MTMQAVTLRVRRRDGEPGGPDFLQLNQEAIAINALALAMRPAGEDYAHLYNAYARKRDWA